MEGGIKLVQLEEPQPEDGLDTHDVLAVSDSAGALLYTYGYIPPERAEDWAEQFAENVMELAEEIGKEMLALQFRNAEPEVPTDGA
jgi:hypothetical protein